MNLARVFSSFLLPEEDLKSILKGGSSPLDAKTWRNTLKYIANIVSYQMKTSSHFINIYTYFIKDTLQDTDKRTKIKSYGISFSEDIFKRHRQLISLISSFENQNYSGMASLALFVKEVSEIGKQELGEQGTFLNKLRRVVNNS